MRKLWTSGLSVTQVFNDINQKVRIAFELFNSEIPDIKGDHDIWFHSSEYEKLQVELREKDLEIEEMKDRLKYEVKMIEGAANDEIHLLNHNIERLINMNKVMREALEFVKDTLDEEKINLGMIKAIDACVFHALEKVDQSTQIGS